MPVMPISFNASFTSVSLKGLMMASIFFIKLKIVLLLLSIVVRAFTVLRQIQTGMFFLRRHAQTDYGVDYFQNHIRDDAAERCRDDHADELILELRHAARQRDDCFTRLERRGDESVD